MTNYNPTQQFKDFDKKPESKPLRYSKDSFTKELIGKVVKISLVNGKDLQGKLSELGMYDIQIEVSENREIAKGMFKDVARKIIMMKSAIVSIEVL